MLLVPPTERYGLARRQRTAWWPRGALRLGMAWKIRDDEVDLSKGVGEH